MSLGLTACSQDRRALTRPTYEGQQVNETFRQHVEALHGKFEALLKMMPVKVATLPKEIPASGIYLFSEGSEHLYVGRSKRVRDRLRYHCGTAPDASFAFKLARERVGKTKASYSRADSRKVLLLDAAFREAYQAAKQRIRQMDLRFIAEPDTNRQALLEIYVTIALGTPYNDFDTH